MKHFLTSALLGLMCLTTVTANAENTPQAEKQIAVANRALNYSYLEELLSDKLAAPISIESIKPKLSKLNVNTGAKITYAIVGSGIKVYNIILKHDSGLTSKCVMSITEQKSMIEENSDLITVSIRDCDGFLQSETGEYGFSIQEYIK